MSKAANELFDPYFRNLREVTREEAPHVYAFLEEAKHQIGYKGPTPTLAISDSKIPNLIAFNAGKNNVPHIGLNEGLLELTGHSGLHEIPSAKLKGVLGHELQHIVDGSLVNQGIRHVPKFAVPIAAIAALYLYYHASDKKDAKQTKITPAQLQEATAATISTHNAMPDDTNHMHKEINKAANQKLFEYGSYLVAGALGWGAGLALTRHLILRNELRADRLGAKLCGDPKAYAECLSDLMKKMSDAFNQTITLRTTAIHTSESVGDAINAFSRRLKGFIQNEKLMGELEIFNAHPSTKARINALKEAFPESFAERARMPESSSIIPQMI